MALRSGYYGLKRKLFEKVLGLPAIKSIGDGLSLNSTTGVLSASGGGGTTVVANPEGTATADLTKLQVGETIYDIESDTSACYQTTDDTETAIVDTDYIPFFDSSAASGEGAPKKSTWSNFCSKIAAKLATTFNKYLGIESLGSGLTLSQEGVLTAAGTGSITITTIGSGSTTFAQGDIEKIISNVVLSTAATTFKFLEFIIQDTITGGQFKFQEAAFFSYQNDTSLRYRFPLYLGRIKGFANIREIDNTHFDITIQSETAVSESTNVTVTINGVL